MTGATEKRLEVFVIFTDAQGTVAATANGRGLAQKLGAHLRLLMPYEVSYALPLTKPPVSVEFLEGQIRDLAAKTGLEVAAQICLCRDKERIGQSPAAEFPGRSGRQETLVAHRGTEACSELSKGWAPRDFRRSEVNCRVLDFTYNRREVTMLDVLYVGVVVAFFILLWGFTRASERL